MVRSGTLQATPPPLPTRKNQHRQAPIQKLAIVLQHSLGGQKTEVPPTFNAFSAKQETEKPVANAFSAPKPPASISNASTSLVSNSRDTKNPGTPPANRPLTDAQKQLRQLAGNPPTGKASNDFSSGRGTQPLMEMPKTDRSAFGSRQDRHQNDAARRNSMPDALSARGLPKPNPIAAAPLPSNGFNTPFAREKNPTSATQAPSVTRLPSPSNDIQRNRTPSNSPSMVRSKAATLPSDTSPPMRPFRRQATEAFQAPVRCRCRPLLRETMFPQQRLPPLDVPGDRRLDGIQNPAIAIQKVPPREFQVNQVSEFMILVKNVGRTAVDEVRVYDRVPAGTQFEGATPQPTKSSNGQLTWDLGTMEPGAEKTNLVKPQTNSSG